MLIKHPAEFARVAEEWAVKYAGAAKRSRGEGSGGSAASEQMRQREKKSLEEAEADRVAQYDDPRDFHLGYLANNYRYGGYNEELINRFVMMGFDLDRVVNAFDYVGIDRNDGEDYELEEAYMGDITARLLGEP